MPSIAMATVITTHNYEANNLLTSIVYYKDRWKGANKCKLIEKISRSLWHLIQKSSDYRSKNKRTLCETRLLSQ
jgi:hypothetical protein